MFYQVWSKIDASKAPVFLGQLGAKFTCHSAAKFVGVDFLIGAGMLDGLLPVPPPAPPPVGALTLALIDVAQRRDKASVRAISYLQGVLGAERWFPARLGVTARLDGLATENEILIAIDRAKPSAKTPDHKVVLVDTASWKMIANWDAHDGDAVGVAWHPSNPLIATTGQDALVRLWSLDGKRVAEAKLPRAGNAVAFSDDGSKLVVATDDKVIVFALKP